MVKTICHIMTWAGTAGMVISTGMCSYCESEQQAIIGISALFVSCLTTIIGALGYE